MTNFIATDNDRTAIYGVGSTEQAAIADAIVQTGEFAGWVPMPCTEQLAAEVEERGGNIAWDEVDGVACVVVDEA